MSHVSARRSRGPIPKPTPGYFDPGTLTDLEAGRLWHGCMQQITESLVAGKSASGRFVLSSGRAVQMYHLFDNRGRLVRFWVRDVLTNQLLIVGNRDGLLPLNVEALHG